ncbi:hypothetical protein [Streptacidiphilus carbonis]|uniref:hypothetical protein n=1 Tax=Streptacidiphilus carbonis TaxID=105422 RepID=UPI0005AA9A9E|nr:hypothetical protein [Streptacidiphilus carbonis]
MTEQLSDTDILDAVARRLHRRRSNLPHLSPSDAEILTDTVVDLYTEWCVEERREKPRTAKGDKDLSGQPRYEELAEYALDPPVYPYHSRTMHLVRRGSERSTVCACGDGRLLCRTCGARGWMQCPPDQLCDACEGVDSCDRCITGTGRRRSRPIERPAGTLRTRVTCKRCGNKQAACPGCLGRGRVRCKECSGDGQLTCQDCKGGRTIPDPACDGTGKFTHWTAGIITRTPGRATKRLCGLPLPPPVRWALRQATPQETRVDNSTELPADLDPGLAKQLMPHLAKQRGEVGRRTRIRQVPLARVLVHQSPHLLLYVLPGLPQPRVLLLPARSLVLKALGTLVTAAALVTVVLLLT